MATITPSTDGPVGSAESVTWETVATGDTIAAHTIEGGSGTIGAAQVTGTFDSAAAAS